MRLFYKGKQYEVSNEGKYHIMKFLTKDDKLKNVYFKRAIRNGEMVWVFSHQRVRSWRKLSEEVERRHFQYIWRNYDK